MMSATSWSMIIMINWICIEITYVMLQELIWYIVKVIIKIADKHMLMKNFSLMKLNLFIKTICLLTPKYDIFKVIYLLILDIFPEVTHPYSKLYIHILK